jgi:hypothetical protein
MSLVLDDSSLVGEDSDDEFDWEEVQVPEQPHLEITLQARPKSDAATKSVAPALHSNDRANNTIAEKEAYRTQKDLYA